MCFQPVVPTVVSCVTALTAAFAFPPATAAALPGALAICGQMQATHTPCWKCYGLNDKVDDKTTFAPCTTRYDGKDQNMKGVISFNPTDLLKNPVTLLSFAKTVATGQIKVAGAMNMFGITPTCNIPYVPRNSQQTMDKLCHDLRRPYTQLNKLKMRYHNPDDKDNIVLTNGVQEGFAFNSYFTNHMPYPRMWDTGFPLLKSTPTDANNQPPTDTTGQYTAIVGIGREAAPKSAGTTATDAHKDERCLLGGWGGSLLGAAPIATIGTTQIAIPDPLTSWTEFKLYQTRSDREIGISCIGRYEKMFKPGSSENLALQALGGDWSRVVVSSCDTTKADTDSDRCTFMSLKEWKNAGSPKSSGNTVINFETKAESFPLAWRGYMSDSTTTNQFPNFGGGYGNTVMGLSAAQVGDVLMMPNGSSKTGTKPGLAKVAVVEEVFLPANGCSNNACYVKVAEADNGKWPDSCGTTDLNRGMYERYLYRPGTLPKDVSTQLGKANWITSCEDTKLSHCEMAEWSTLQLYRIPSDIRKGCTKKDPSTCK